jgi:hypothetical protein
MAWKQIPDQGRGKCRRRSPAIDDKGNGAWPKTLATEDGCEEFKAKPNAKEENITE